MEHYKLNDGREPLRFDSGRAAFYAKARGEGEVRYTFSMIKWFQNHRPLLSDVEKKQRHEERVAKLLQKNPRYFNEIGVIGGRNSKRGKHDGAS